MGEQPKHEFADIAAEETQPGIIHEYLGFLKDNKKWWLLPMLVVLLLLGLLLLISGTAAAPFIYTMF
jgi:Family of unknown function (DUF5989)